MSNILEDFQKYRDHWGLNQLYTDGCTGFTTQNGALFTMEYFLTLWSSDIWDAAKDHESDRVAQAFLALEIAPGLTVRAPDSREGDSMDNVGALLAFSSMFDSGGFAKRFLEHGENVKCNAVDMQQDPERNMRYYPIAWLVNLGKAPRYFWNNTRPTEFCIWGWYGRSPGFLALARFCATGKLGWLDAAALWVGQFIGLTKARTDADARKLPYIIWQAVRHKNLFWSLSYKLWCRILMFQYPNGMRDVYALYYQDHTHPIHYHSVPYIK